MQSCSFFKTHMFHFQTDRRVLPRRSAKNAAINHLKELTSPTKKVANKESGKKKGRSSRNVKPTKSEECSPVRENNASVRFYSLRTSFALFDRLFIQRYSR